MIFIDVTTLVLKPLVTDIIFTAQKRRKVGGRGSGGDGGSDVFN